MSDNPQLIRFTVDMVVKEPLSEHRIESIAKEITENLHVVGVESNDQVLKHVEKYAVGHTHDATENRCTHCVEQSLDYRNAAVVLGG